ncbi:hypothetical protein ABV409_16580 [Flagellimonas sp. DF-77]|uniref:hypothetical protein n=1 Tax=Flagellimonas algarum TaxID=3230298 RepID=UPI003395E2A5
MAKEFDNPFKQLNTNLREVPAEMRQRVMNDVAIAKLILDMSILVTSNYASLLAGLFRTNKRNH